MRKHDAARGPLDGIRVLEFAGIGPAPFAGMLLADLGADILRIEREGGTGLLPMPDSPVERGRRSLVRDLKSPGAVALCLRIAEKADVLIEGFRPGVMERLGLGPDAVLQRNPRLIYGRMTGWSQTGPLANAVGHDINYLALSGALAAMGPADRPPVPPLNAVGDMGGGGAFLVIGILAAILERQASGRGQVVDAAILDGTAAQLAIVFGLRAGGAWDRPRGQNILDGGAPFYRTYACADEKFIAVGALEPKFFAALLRGLDLDVDALAQKQYDHAEWPGMHGLFERIFSGKIRDAWAAKFEGSDACVTPVLDFGEAAVHPHNAARGTFASSGGVLQGVSAPRFSRSGCGSPPAAASRQSGEAALAEWGIAV